MGGHKNRMPCLLAIIAAVLFIGLLLGVASIGAVWLLRTHGSTPPAVVATMTPAIGTFAPTPTTIVAAATPTVGNLVPTPTKVAVEIPKDKETCLAMGGRWGRIGLAPREECNLPTGDGGKVCTDTHECEGMCLAELSPAERDQIVKNKVPLATQGKCTSWKIVVGCIARIENGKVGTILCID
jgi:hypothetical protein